MRGVIIFSSFLTPDLFQSCSGFIFFDLTPISPPSFTLWRRFALSLRLLLLPNSLGRRSAIHLDSAPTHQPPLIFCTYIPCWATTRSSFRKLVTVIPCLVAPHLLASTCTQVPVIPRGSYVWGYLPPSACLHFLNVFSPPLPSSTGAFWIFMSWYILGGGVVVENFSKEFSLSRPQLTWVPMPIPFLPFIPFIFSLNEAFLQDFSEVSPPSSLWLTRGPKIFLSFS